MILQEDITYDDLIFIDKELYKSLKNLKDLVTTSYSDDIYDGLYIYYSVDIKDTNNKMHNLDLVENGSEKPVKNINDYINKRISLMKGLYEPFIQKIRESLFNLIPKDVKFLRNLTDDLNYSLLIDNIFLVFNSIENILQLIYYNQNNFIVSLDLINIFLLKSFFKQENVEP
jgi:hypothetical protein